MCFLSYNITFSQTQNDSVELPPYLKTGKLPDFTLLKADSSYFYQNELIINTPTVFVYFNTDCDHCQQEAKAMVDSATYLMKVQVVFVSNENIKDVIKFAKDYGLNNHKSFAVTTDINNDIYRFFEPNFAPFVVIYDKKGQFIKTFEGGTSVANIIDLTR
jgi:peroxiredoxin